MGLISEDYNEVRRQIEELNNHFLTCISKREYADCFIGYKNLCSLYKMCTGIDLFSPSGTIKILASLTEEDRVDEMFHLFYKSFIDNKVMLNKMFEKMLFPGVEAYTDLLERDDYLRRVIPKSISCEMEAMEIVYSFLDSTFPETKDLFGELLSRGRIFKIPSSLEMKSDTSKRGFSFFNFASSFCDVFLEESLDDVSGLATFIHEFGHVVDMRELSNNSYSRDGFIHGFRLGEEDLACAFKFKFLEYLIKNDIYKDNAKKVLFGDIGEFLSELENSFFLSSLISDEFEGMINGEVKSEEFIEGLSDEALNLTIPMYLLSDDFESAIPIVNSLNSSSGFAIGVCFSDSNVCRSFMNNIGERNYARKIELAGINGDIASKHLIKKINSLYA